MAVTKQTFTASATWTASQLADAFRDAFIAAGLMTAWHDSFLNTIENRVLRVVYDNTKTYGTVYYWFMFTTAGVWVNTALDWNVTTHVPQGTQYLDYFSTVTNSTSTPNHNQLISLSAATTATVTRYTSAINTGVTWFVVRNGTTSQAFSVASPTWGPSNFVDLNKTAYNSIITCGSQTSSGVSCLNFSHISGHTRRTYLGADCLRGSASTSGFSNIYYFQRYLACGNANNTTNNFSSGTSVAGVYLPTAAANTNTSLSADHRPVFTGPTVTPYQAPLPDDFGVVSYIASNAMAVQDTFVVTAGVEEWEMITITTNALMTEAGKIFFLARTV